MFRSLLRMFMHIAKLVLTVRPAARVTAASLVGVHTDRSVFRRKVEKNQRIAVASPTVVMLTTPAFGVRFEVAPLN
jgi:hypothetical protein